MSELLRERIRDTLDLLAPLAREWVESPEAVGTAAAMAVAFLLPTVAAWRERLGELDIEQTEAVVTTGGELLAWLTDQADPRTAVELAVDVVTRLSDAGVMELPTELAALAAAVGADSIPGPGGDLRNERQREELAGPADLPERSRT